MTIQRLYQPDPAALERVVEILYRLPVEPDQGCGEVTNEQQSGTEESSFVSGEAEA